MRYVDSDYLLDALAIFNDTVHGDQNFLNGIRTAEEIIREAPENRGRWIQVIDENGFFRNKCEKCGSILHRGYKVTRYCPNCGALMFKEN